MGIEETPGRESVLSAYPNPFREYTTIEYTLEQNASVTLAIFNHLGQAVTTLVNKPQTKGKQQVQWNTAGLPAGIYYCRLQAGNQPFSAKLIIIQ
ncbi:MAG: T9SS type A sorting domain-containing protein [Bacteroidales bacterium]|nr:T9SS type A sorting domain-containing protein [Bacteroidales bacterium]